MSSSSQSASDRHPTAASADVVVCGAGLAGISTAFYLTEQCGVPGHRVIIIDERSPLEYTSSRSTECFRTLWQDECMARFMTRSIDLIERLHAQPPLDSVVKVEHRSSPSADLAGQARATSSAVAAPFAFRRSGYVWLTNDPQTATEFEGTARRSKAAETATTADDKRTKSTADGVRIHASLQSYTALSEAEAWRLGGADIVHGADAIRSLYPFVSPDVKAMLHARRAGSLDAQQMGSYMLARARARGVTVLRGRVTDVHVTNNAITGVMVARPSVSDGSYGGSASALHYISCPSFVNAAGPAAKGVHSLLNHAILQQRRSISDLRVSVDMQSVAHSESSSTLKGKAVPSTFALPQLPVSNEVHAKVLCCSSVRRMSLYNLRFALSCAQAVFLDSLNVLPADGPLMIWADPVQLQWSRDELEALSEAGPEQQRWLRLLPSGTMI